MDNKNTKVQMIAAPAAEIESPVFKTVNNKDYIYYGINNNYPDILIDMMNGSSLHSSILKKKTDMTAGKGIEETKSNKDFIANINGKEDLNDIIYKAAYDLTLYGGFSYLITWSKDKSKIARVQYIDFSKVRIVKELDDGSEVSELQKKGVDFYQISADWTQTRKEKYKPQQVQGFSTEYKQETTQLVYQTSYRPGCQDLYALPDYQATSTYIALDIEIGSHHLHSVQNSFSPSMVISMVGVPSDEEVRTFQRKLEEQYAGSANSGKIILTISEDESQLPQITPLQLNDSDQRYKDLSDSVKEQIITGHRASSVVVGVATAGKLGNTEEIIQAEAMFQHNVIDNYQILLEKSFTRIMNVNQDGEIILKKSVTFDLDDVVEEDVVVDENRNIENSDKDETNLIKDSYNDYPQSAVNNAKRAIKLNEKSGNKCATDVGKQRAQQISNKRPLSLDTIKRTFSYLSRAEEYYNPSDTTACGTISYLLWGGKSMKAWCESKINKINKEKDAK